MILLAADTSGPQGSLALASIRDGQLESLFDTSWDKKATHSEVATLQLQSLLKSAGKSAADVTHLAVNTGPGSFTGLRVGVSLIRTFAYSQAKPVALINRLEVLAFKNSAPGDKVFVATKAVQNFYYAAGYERLPFGLLEQLSPRSLDQSELDSHRTPPTKVLIEGDKNGLEAFTCARDLVELLLMERNLRPFSDWSHVNPLYIRASEAEEKLKRGLLKPL